MTGCDRSRIMTSNGQSEHPAVFFDGSSNRKRRVALRFSRKLEIAEDDLVIASWPYDDIRRADGQATLRLSAVSALPLARLEVADEATAQTLLARCGALDLASGGSQTWRIVGWSLAAACSILLITLYGIPLLADRLAPLVPIAAEKRLGDAVDKQVRALMGGHVCAEPAGQRAFAKMVDRLREAGGVSSPMEAQVLSSAIPNAVALPGGKIYLFEGLLQKAQNPDEIAGVIAHELGHAHRRDGLRQLIQTGGTSFLIGLLFGDITGSGAVIFGARSILDASHSRDAESGADDFAVAAMTGLGRSPAALGEFLVRITGSDSRGTILDSHPLSAERLDRMKRLDRPTTGPAILTDVEWQALKDICVGSKP